MHSNSGPNRTSTRFPLAIPIGQTSGLLPPLQDAGKGWSSLTKIPSCLWQICDSLSSGQASKINPACCSSINQVSDDCRPKMFPCHPFFPSLLKNFCAALSPDQPTGANSGSKLSVPSVNETEITECWSSITSKEWCASEIFKSLTSHHWPNQWYWPCLLQSCH